MSKTILIAEDDWPTRELLLEIFKSAGYNFLTAEDGLQALEIIRKENVDLVIMDIGMPNMDGMEALEKIRNISTRLPVIILSVWADPEYQAIALKYGAFKYLRKPFSVDDLRTAIQGALGKEEILKETPLFQDLVTPKPFTPKKRRWFLTLLAVISVFVLTYAFMQYRQHTNLPAEFTLHYSNPTGITWDGKNIWISDWSAQSIFKHNVNPNLTLEKTYHQSDWFPVTISWGDFALWSVGQDGKIRKHFPHRNFSASDPFETAGLNPTAIAWDGETLWSSDREEKKIHRHILNEELTIDVSYNYPGQNPVGMTWLDNELWIADETVGTIYHFTYENGIFTLSGSYSPDVHRQGIFKLSGICTDGKNLWTISEGSGKVFRHPLSQIRNDIIQ